jgi:NTP pyrophosphatase (non-canonical NTP hydrolase)
MNYLHLETNSLTQLKDMQARVREINLVNGWFDPDKPRSFGDDIALLHSEVSEAYEAYRDWGLEDKTRGPIRGCPSEAPVDGDTCIHGQEWNVCTANSPLQKPEGVGSELADVLVRLLDTCERYGIDLEAEFERKLKYNATRGYRHGGKRV